MTIIDEIITEDELFNTLLIKNHNENISSKLIFVANNKLAKYLRDDTSEVSKQIDNAADDFFKVVEKLTKEI
jgi:hypothetical protein